MISDYEDGLNRALSRLEKDYLIFGADDDLLGRPFRLLPDISDWRYSTANNFDYEPYHNQLGGFGGGRIIRKKYSGPMESKGLGQYASGFVDGVLVVTVVPTKIERNLSVLYYINDDERCLRLTVHYKLNDGCVERARLSAVQAKFSIRDDLVAFVGTGESGESSVKIYEYNGGKPVKVYLWASKWPGEDVLSLSYDFSGELERVTSPTKDGGEVDIWRKKQ